MTTAPSSQSHTDTQRSRIQRAEGELTDHVDLGHHPRRARARTASGGGTGSWNDRARFVSTTTYTTPLHNTDPCAGRIQPPSKTLEIVDHHLVWTALWSDGRKELASSRASTSHGLATLAPLTDLTLALEPTQTTRHYHNHAHQILTRLRCYRGEDRTHLLGGRSVGRYRTRSRASRARPDAHRRTTAGTPAGYTHKGRTDGEAGRGRGKRVAKGKKERDLRGARCAIIRERKKLDVWRRPNEGEVSRTARPPSAHRSEPNFFQPTTTTR